MTSTTDLARLVPGFNVADSELSVPVYTLRGVGLSEGSLAASPTVAVYVDEVPLPYPAMTREAAGFLWRGRTPVLQPVQRDQW